MKPPICEICSRRFNPDTEGGLIYFMETPEGREFDRRVREEGITGHPPDAGWFCGLHAEEAKKLSHLTISVAAEKMKDKERSLRDAMERLPPNPRGQNLKYTVFVDDNFHYMDESERYELGEFETCEEAVEACKKIVNEFLEHGYQKGVSFKELWEGYILFGEDPFIVSGDVTCRFSAWDYARRRCAELCGSAT